jgi:hypothetical protein
VHQLIVIEIISTIVFGAVVVWLISAHPDNPLAGLENLVFVVASGLWVALTVIVILAASGVTNVGPQPQATPTATPVLQPSATPSAVPTATPTSTSVTIVTSPPIIFRNVQLGISVIGVFTNIDLDHAQINGNSSPTLEYLHGDLGQPELRFQCCFTLPMSRGIRSLTLLGYHTCRDAADHNPQPGARFDHFSYGMQICVQTVAGNFARLRVIGVPTASNQDTLTVDETLWKARLGPLF